MFDWLFAWPETPWGWATLVLFIYYGIPAVITQCYFWILWFFGQIAYEGFVFIRVGPLPIPVLRARLLPNDSPYQKLWKGMGGMALSFAMIHRDRKGTDDDAWVEEVIIHERQHCIDGLIFGILQWLMYPSISAYLWIKQKIKKDDTDPYRDNWFEVRARKAEAKWIAAGRPRWFDFGRRY